MSAPGWAQELGHGIGPELTMAVLACALASWATPERLGAVLAGRLGCNASTDVADVLAELRAPPNGADAPGRVALDTAARALLDLDARVVAVGRPGYPPQLAQTWPELGAPAWLFMRGRLAPARLPPIAVVGTRQPTLDGLKTAKALGRYLAKNGVPVISGMARGIDQAGHAGALEGGGVTTAVLGTGFGVDYPARSGGVRDAIAASGGLVTEYPPGTPVRPHQFLERNRIISGLSAAVVVVEGRQRSGALQTARLAASQGREVLVVPGSLNAATSQGPLALIRDGARVLTCFEDALEVLGVSPDGSTSPRAPPSETLGVAARVLHGLLGPQPASAGALAEAADLDTAEALGLLAELEARGLARYTARGFVANDLAM